jgi:hypothetical protein
MLNLLYKLFVYPVIAATASILWILLAVCIVLIAGGSFGFVAYQVANRFTENQELRWVITAFAIALPGHAALYKILGTDGVANTKIRGRSNSQEVKEV